MIYDCFLFNNELDILEIRLNELSEVVDKFVLVESTVKHVNKPKPLYFDKNKKRFRKFEDKIIHIIVKDSPDVNLPWIINDYQFSQISRGLTHCKSDDIIIFGDLDEIPRAAKIKEYMGRPGKLKIFQQTLSFYYLNCMECSHDSWLGTRMTTYENFKKYNTPWIAKYSKVDVKIPNGGWHFSYIGDVKWIQDKLAGMTHQEFNNSRYNTPEKIRKSISEGKDFLDAGRKFRISGMEEMPFYVQNNQDKFAKLIVKKLESETPAYFILSGYLNLKRNMRIVYRKIRKYARIFIDEKRKN